MKRRALCLLLAILTVFALAVPAFAEDEADASGSIGNDLEWTLSGGTVTISGTGEMFQYYEPEKWEKSQKLFENVIIEPGVTGLRPNAFSYCENLKSVTLPDTLTSIAINAFQMCTGLTSVNIPGSVDTIGAGAFAECDSLKDVTIGKGVRIIQGSAFRSCPAASITIPDTVTVVDYSAFAYCKSLQSVTFPKSVVAIGGDVFWGCTSLKDVTVLNPECLIDGEADTLGVPGTTVVYGYAGSTAETYANTYGYTFKDLSHLEAPTVKIAQTDGGISVTWNAVKGSPRYMVYYKENGGSWKKIGSTAKTSYTWKKAKAGATYQFAVRCCDSDKKTLLSGYKASNKVKYTVELAAPTVKIAQTKSGIQVTWNAVKGSPRYMVYYKENGGKWQQIGSTAKTSYTCKASALKAGATYQFAVRCCASDKKTLLSGYEASNKVKYVPELAAPTVKIAQTDGGIQVTWNAVDGSARYMVYYKENGGKWQQIGSTAKTSYTRKGSALKAGATYQFAVRCCAGDKKTLLSGYEASNKIKYAVELAAPAVQAVLTDNGIKVSWGKVAGAAAYRVFYKTSKSGGWKKIGDTAETSYTRGSAKLTPGVTYWFTVRCVSGDGSKYTSAYDTVGRSVAVPEREAPETPDVPKEPGSSGSSGGSAVPEDPDGVSYVLNTNTMKFHLPACRWADEIAPENRKDVKADRDAVIASGYAPCLVCGP